MRRCVLLAGKRKFSLTPPLRSRDEKLVKLGEFGYKGIGRRALRVAAEYMAEPEPPKEKPDQWWEFCPLCGSKLINRKCRFVCSDPKCHYFMSCSEFDL